MKRYTSRFAASNFHLQITKDFVVMAVVFLISIYVVYFTTQDIARLLFLAFLILFLFSRYDHFWFAYFFVIAQGPGYFFADFSGYSVHRLPLYTFLPGMSFTPIDLFVFIALFKAMDRGKKVTLKLKKPALILLAYIILTIAATSFIYGANVDMLAWNLRWLFYYSIVISFLYLVNVKREIYRFIFLIFPFVVFNLFTQIYFLNFGNEFINSFDPGFRALALNTVTGELRPVIGGGLLTFFSYIFAIFLLTDRRYQFSKISLYVVVVVAFFSVFLSATRLWFVIFAFILIGYLIVSRKKILSTVGVFAGAIVLIIVLLYSGLISQNLLLNSSWGRLRQVFYVFGGDVYSIDTASARLIKDLPVILNIIKQNPFIGYGMSGVAMNYYNSDLGFFNTILMFGIVGFSLFLYLFVRIFMHLHTAIRGMSKRNPLRISLKMLVFIWVAVLIGYFTTWDFFTMDFDKIFFVSLLIALTESLMMQAQREELDIRY